jgi:hypothetical protein
MYRLVALSTPSLVILAGFGLSPFQQTMLHLLQGLVITRSVYGISRQGSVITQSIRGALWTHVWFSPTNPQHLISVSSNRVCQWDADGHQTRPPFDGQHVSFSLDGTHFVSCHGKTVTVYNSSSGETVSEFQITGSDAYRCFFSPDSRLVAVAAG